MTILTFILWKMVSKRISRLANMILTNLVSAIVILRQSWDRKKSCIISIIEKKKGTKEKKREKERKANPKLLKSSWGFHTSSRITTKFKSIALMYEPAKRTCKPDSASSLQLSSAENVALLLYYRWWKLLYLLLAF